MINYNMSGVTSGDMDYPSSFCKLLVHHGIKLSVYRVPPLLTVTCEQAPDQPLLDADQMLRIARIAVYILFKLFGRDHVINVASQRFTSIIKFDSYESLQEFVTNLINMLRSHGINWELHMP